MSEIKRIVCLANSRKLSGRCIAGKEYSGVHRGEWIRPVSARPKEEVSEYERQYPDGSDPRVLDIIDLPVLAPKPTGFQRENWLLDPGYYWEKVDQIPSLELASLADHTVPLWINGFNTYNGLNDEIPLSRVDAVESSLRLVHVAELHLRVFAPSRAFGNTKRRVQGFFRLGAEEYALWVTDPIYEREYLAKEDGRYGIGASYLTISLGEPFEGGTYKLIAAIIPSDES